MGKSVIGWMADTPPGHPFGMNGWEIGKNELKWKIGVGKTKDKKKVGLHRNGKGKKQDKIPKKWSENNSKKIGVK